MNRLQHYYRATPNIVLHIIINVQRTHHTKVPYVVVQGRRRGSRYTSSSGRAPATATNRQTKLSSCPYHAALKHLGVFRWRSKRARVRGTRCSWASRPAKPTTRRAFNKMAKTRVPRRVAVIARGSEQSRRLPLLGPEVIRLLKGTRHSRTCAANR